MTIEEANKAKEIVKTLGLNEAPSEVINDLLNAFYDLEDRQGYTNHTLSKVIDILQNSL